MHGSQSTVRACGRSSSAWRAPRCASTAPWSARSARGSRPARVGHDDDDAEADRLATRVARLRVFPDAPGRFDPSLLDTAGAALVVSQFTLYGDTAQGNRPSFSEAAAPELAEPLYERVCARLAPEGVSPVERGRFGAAWRSSSSTTVP